MSEMPMEQTSEELISRMESALAKDGVWVSPALRISAADEARIEKAVADFDGTAKVALINLDYDDTLTGGDFKDLAGIFHDDTDVDGIYLGLETTYGDEGPSLVVASFPEQYDLYQAARIAKLEHPDDITGQVETALTAIGKGDLDAQFDAARAAHPQRSEKYFGSYGDSSGSSGTAGSSGTGSAAGSGDGPGAWPVVGGVTAAVLVIAVGWAWLTRRRRGYRPASRVREFQLPRAVLSTVRAAEDTRNEQQASAESLALGEKLSAAAMPKHSPAALDAWQAALDHYEVARRIMDRRHTAADVVGAIVLTRRGESALAAARSTRRTGWAPTPGCYFNPLHTSRASRVDWHGDRGSVTVPACVDCAAAVRDGIEPDDVLDFVHDKIPRHYFNLDLGAWSDTGYGSLDTDLLGRLMSQ